MNEIAQMSSRQAFQIMFFFFFLPVRLFVVKFLVRVYFLLGVPFLTSKIEWFLSG